MNDFNLPLAIARTLISLAILGGGAAGFLALGKGEAPPTQKPATLPMAVQVAEVVTHTDGIEFETDGVVVPYRQLQLATEVAGVVSYKADQCRVGRTVRKGDVLIRIDARDYEFEVQRLAEQQVQATRSIAELEVEVASAQNALQLGKEDLELRRRDLQRYLTAKDPGVFSGAEVDAARRNELAARNSVQTQTDQLTLLQSRKQRLESARELAQTQLLRAKLDLARTEVVAPMTGIVISESVEQNGYLQKGGMIATIQDTSRLEVTCSVHMKQLHWIWQTSNEPAPIGGQGQQVDRYQLPPTPAKIVYRLGDVSYTWNGILDRYDGAGVDQQTRMARCRVQVRELSAASVQSDNANSNQTLKSPTLMTGMYVKVFVQTMPSASLLRLPVTAIKPGNVVWSVEDGKLKRNEVQVAQGSANPNQALDSANGKFALIYHHANSLGPGAQVVISPLASPTNGGVVTISNTP